MNKAESIIATLRIVKESFLECQRRATKTEDRAFAARYNLGPEHAYGSAAAIIQQVIDTYTKGASK